MKPIYTILILLTLSSYIGIGQTAAISVGLTSPTNFLVTFTPSADIVAANNTIVPYGIVITLPKSTYPVQPAIAGFAFTPNPTFGTAISTGTFDDTGNGFWVYRFINSPAATVPGPTTYTGGTAYTLGSFTVPPGVNISDISFRDYANNNVVGPGTGGTVLSIGGASRINNSAVFAQNTDSTNPPSNSGVSSQTSSLQFNSAPLPIELLTFEPRTDKCDAYLYWETATEKNFGYFQIEASKDGREFKALAQQKPASSNSSEKRTYKYSIPSAYQGFYFRLKSVDLDGAFDYSDIVATQTPCTKAYEVQLYPNPVNQWLQVQLDGGQQDEIYELTVLNLLGQRVPMPRTQVRQRELHRLDTTDWTPGAYWLQLRTERGELVTTIPFAKIN
jgi:hypothetical protein